MQPLARDVVVLLAVRQRCVTLRPLAHRKGSVRPDVEPRCRPRHQSPLGSPANTNFTSRPNCSELSLVRSLATIARSSSALRCLSHLLGVRCQVLVKPLVRRLLMRPPFRRGRGQRSCPQAESLEAVESLEPVMAAFSAALFVSMNCSNRESCSSGSRSMARCAPHSRQSSGGIGGPKCWSESIRPHLLRPHLFGAVLDL